MSQNDCIGKTLKPWPILVDHYNFSFRFNLTDFRKQGTDHIAPNFLKGIDDAEVKANALYEYMNEKCHAKSMEIGTQLPEAVQPQLAAIWDIICTAIETNDKPHYDAYFA